MAVFMEFHIVKRKNSFVKRIFFFVLLIALIVGLIAFNERRFFYLQLMLFLLFFQLNIL
jgi:hypothetical protein